MANHYEVPSWAGKAPTGHHLDVSKDDKLIQKLMIDEKKCYLFGRNPQLNDFCIDHGSCSRVHASLIYHKHLNISYLVDLGSTHGTFIGNLQIEAHKPMQLHMNTTFHFGASTRYYTIRERPTAGSRSINIMEDIPMNESDGALLGLPECQTELDNLTEYNTAHNRRIAMLGITDDSGMKKNANKTKRKRRSVTFNDEEIIINPEDIDPAVGRFRNMIQTTVVPTKRIKYDNHMGVSTQSSFDGAKHLHPSTYLQQFYQELPSAHLYQDLPPTTSADGEHQKTNSSSGFDGDITAIGTKLGLILPNPAPDVTPAITEAPSLPIISNSGSFAVSPNKNPNNKSIEDQQQMEPNSNEPKKKKYAKEAWPGRKPLLSTF